MFHITIAKPALFIILNIHAINRPSIDAVCDQPPNDLSNALESGRWMGGQLGTISVRRSNAMVKKKTHNPNKKWLTDILT